jgi:hypothetical protein
VQSIRQYHDIGVDCWLFVLIWSARTVDTAAHDLFTEGVGSQITSD